MRGKFNANRYIKEFVSTIVMSIDIEHVHTWKAYVRFSLVFWRSARLILSGRAKYRNLKYQISRTIRDKVEALRFFLQKKKKKKIEKEGKKQFSKQYIITSMHIRTYTQIYLLCKCQRGAIKKHDTFVSRKKFLEISSMNIDNN